MKKRSEKSGLKLHEFLLLLEEKDRWYQLDHIREDAIMVTTAVPGERWEIEFFEDGHVEVEVFKSDGHMFDEEFLKKNRKRLWT